MSKLPSIKLDLLAKYLILLYRTSFSSLGSPIDPWGDVQSDVQRATTDFLDHTSQANNVAYLKTTVLLFIGEITLETDNSIKVTEKCVFGWLWHLS